MTRRCVLLFARPAPAEGLAKGIPLAEPLFEEARERIGVMAERLGVDLVLVGPARQRGETFGERLANAFADARSAGYAETVMVPGDVPALSASDLETAFAAVADGAVALGPSRDGGVYLLGTSTDPSTFLAGVRWLTGHVAGDLVEAVVRAGLRTALLRTLTDVDGRRSLASLLHDATVDPALRRLLRSLLAGSVPELEPPAPAASAAGHGPVSLRAPPVAA